MARRLSSKGQSSIEQLETAECGIGSGESTSVRHDQTTSHTLPVFLVRVMQTGDGPRSAFDERNSAGQDAPNSMV